MSGGLYILLDFHSFIFRLLQSYWKVPQKDLLLGIFQINRLNLPYFCFNSNLSLHFVDLLRITQTLTETSVCVLASNVCSVLTHWRRMCSHRSLHFPDPHSSRLRSLKTNKPRINQFFQSLQTAPWIQRRSCTSQNKKKNNKKALGCFSFSSVLL